MDNSQIEKEVLPVENQAKISLDKFKLRNSNKLLILSILLFCLLLISVFKNISYPLFWADESMTAIGTERVLQFGYPKVHDGKNVFYDLRHSNPVLGINEKDDAYVGGAGWGQYYFGIIGYKLAQLTNDIYFKTAIFRTTFAIAGLLGLLLIAYFISRFFPDKFSKYAFFALFMLLELSSVSLALLLREVRYYSLVILLSGIIIGMYSVFRYYKPFNRIVFVSVLAISLFFLYVTFAPVYFIVLITVVISEILMGIFLLTNLNFKTILTQALPVIIALFVSMIGVLPLLFYFKTFEISKAMSEFNSFDREMYWFNVWVV
ncbi:MAG: hypothetical protein NTX97_09545, partial [Bacteroidetes bacterium]|nr:hypothetical protein [Bacteroidota bacterium]